MKNPTAPLVHSSRYYTNSQWGLRAAHRTTADERQARSACTFYRLVLWQPREPKWIRVAKLRAWAESWRSAAGAVFSQGRLAKPLRLRFQARLKRSEWLR